MLLQNFAIIPALCFELYRGCASVFVSISLISETTFESTYTLSLDY